MSKFTQPHAQPEHEKHANVSVVNVNIKSDDIFNFISQNDLDRKIMDTSLFNDSTNRQPFNDDLIRCYALRPQENCFGIRVNTILAYCAINQKVPRINFFCFFFIFRFEHILRAAILISFYRFLIYGTKYSH